MKRSLLSIAVMVACAFATSNAKADLIFSTSSTDALAGSTLDLGTGGTGTLYTWVSSNNPPNNLIGLAFSVASSDGTIVDAVSHVVENPELVVGTGIRRWAGSNGGAVNANGNLVNDAASANLPTGGISSSTGPDSYVLHSTLTLQAVGDGSTTLSFAAHSNAGNGITYAGVTGNQFANTTKGTATVNVGGTAIPEPGSLIALAGLGLGMLARRRRS